MNDLKKAIRLRNNGKRKEALKILQLLTKKFPKNALIHYHCGWTYDSLGMEREAIPYYEKVLTGKLSGDDRKGVFIGLGSSYRCLGKYKKSLRILNRGIKKFPKSRVLYIERVRRSEGEIGLKRGIFFESSIVFSDGNAYILLSGHRCKPTFSNFHKK